MHARRVGDLNEYRRLRRAIVAALIVVGVGSARADFTSELQVHGFVSQGFLKSSDNNFLASTDRGSFEFFEAGLNVQKQLTSKFRLGIQLFTRDLGPIGNYEAKIDWAFLDYRWRDWLGLRAGRIKLPFGLYNDTSDIDAANPTALLPQAVYPAENRDFLLAQTGGELYGYRRVGRKNAFDYRAYAGTIFIDFPAQQSSGVQLLRFEIPYVAGGRLMWESPIDGMKLGASVQRLRLDTEFLDARDPAMPVLRTADIYATLAMASFEYLVDQFVFAAEYARWYTRIDSNDPMSDGRKATQERAYVLASYRATRRVQPRVYYGVFYRQAGETEGKESKQHDAAAALRFDLNPYWLLKLEGHKMRGTAGLSAALNPDGTRNNWWLFVLKTTAYF
jgi:hypothetical protein